MAAALPHYDIAIVGGGIAGLSAAHRAVADGASVALLERGGRVGGKMASSRHGDFLVEHGPHSFRHNALYLWRLIETARIRERVWPAKVPGHRYVFRDGLLRRMPSGPADLLRSDWLSTGGKLRALMEPFISSQPDPLESLGDFARRRFGTALTEALVAPFVSGIYAGDIEQLSVADAFPALHAAEVSHGSVIRGMLRRRRQVVPSPAPAKGVYGFDSGMGGLAEAIGDALPEGVVRTETAVAEISRKDRKFHLKVVAADSATALDDRRKEVEELSAERLILATTAPACAHLLQAQWSGLAAAMPAIEQVPVALVHLGGSDPNGAAPRGFGCLIARGEGIEALGILFPSASFDARAATGHWLHSVFLGGAHDREILRHTDDVLISIARRSHAEALASIGAAELHHSFGHVVRYACGIPQFTAGHRDRVASFRQRLSEVAPGMFVAGSFFDGISVGDAAQSGADACEQAMAWAAAT